jgi:uncharacterized protein (DUF39 family)
MAAVDFFLGATALPDDDPETGQARRILYGGGLVIEELVAGKDIRLIATAYGRTATPGETETLINIMTSMKPFCSIYEMPIRTICSGE